MIRFSDMQKKEFDKLKAQDDMTSLYDALYKVQNNEQSYPVLFYYLYGDADNCSNQDEFAQAWAKPEQISTKQSLYYLVIFPNLYVSLDQDDNVSFTTKDDNSKPYKKQFTQVEINELQLRDEFKNKFVLDSFKKLVEE